MTVKLLTKQHLELLSLKGGCTGSSAATLVKMPHYWKSHVGANVCFVMGLVITHGVYSYTPRKLCL